MRKLLFVLLVASLAARCGRSRAAGTGGPHLTSQAFIISTLLDAAGDLDIAVLATRRGDLPETRELGALMHRSSIGMRDDLTSTAQRRNIALPKGVEERKVALRDNLSFLQGDLFDRAYAFAVVQETTAMLRTFDAFGATNDSELRQFIAKYSPALQEQQRLASRLLSRLGGSPWPGVSP
jgi:hypothetical protein